MYAVLVLLPVVAVAAAAAMNRWQSNVGMFLFVCLLVVVVVSLPRLADESLFPAAIFFVSLSLLLHRNLLGDWVIGADIQAIYAVAQHVFEVGTWTPGAISTPVPVVSVVPAVVSRVAGLTVVATFKTLYVLVFSLVSVGLYYVAREVFDPDVALYGALFFQFYHLSFIFTPGKQLVSELFVVLLLLTIWDDGARVGRTVVIGLLTAGLVLTHYGMTYAFGGALLFATVCLAIGRRRFPKIEQPVSVVYPVLLLAAATAWYAYVAPGLIETLVDIPTLVASQITALVEGGESVGGSGASAVASESSIGGAVRVTLYFLLTVLVGFGIASRALAHVDRLRLGDDPGRMDFTALAVPMFLFLGSSYFFVLNLWAARVYQLVLVVLASFMPYGFAVMSETAGKVFDRSRDRFGRRGGSADRERRGIRLSWTPLAALLALLLVFNSGMAFALTGTAQTSTFNPDANDLVFRDGELEGAKWLEQRPEIERTGLPGPPEAASTDRDASVDVRVFTDPYGAQLLRAILPERYYNVEVVPLKSQWRPSFDRSNVGEGYVFVRKRSVTADRSDGALPPTFFSRGEIAVIEDSGRVVFENRDVVIYETDGGAGT